MAWEEAARRRRKILASEVVTLPVNPVGDPVRVIPAAPLQNLDTSSQKERAGHTAAH